MHHILKSVWTLTDGPEAELAPATEVAEDGTVTLVTVEPEADDWQDGPPAGFLPAVLAADLRAYRRFPCPGCGSRQPVLIPQHTAEGLYRLLCLCIHCHHETTC